MSEIRVPDRITSIHRWSDYMDRGECYENGYLDALRAVAERREHLISGMPDSVADADKVANEMVMKEIAALGDGK